MGGGVTPFISQVSKGNPTFFFHFCGLHVMNIKYANFDKYLSVAIIVGKYLKFLHLLALNRQNGVRFCLFGFLPQALIQNRIKLSSMTGVYALLAVGAVFAFLVLIAEIQWERKHKMLRNIPRCVKAVLNNFISQKQWPNKYLNCQSSTFNSYISV